MGIPFTVPMGFLFTVTLAFLFTMTLGFQLTMSILAPSHLCPPSGAADPLSTSPTGTPFIKPWRAGNVRRRYEYPY
jgi:hypothetical protein